ncbi:MAG: hypothetical protein BWX68_02951 [Verrucomicrobia bacterium ADurb.Bin063]|nr:MAG: hypothetical protein BWX68_02951 [Verrucomicrobia bacterium ADurb.Bin063]
MLHALQPVPGLEQPRLAHIQVQGPQPAQHLPGAVDIIDPPAAVPRAVFLLPLANEPQRPLHLGMLHAPAFVAEQLQDARRDVGAFGIQHGVMVGKGNLFEHALGAVLVESRPAAVLALEGHHPGQAPLETFVALLPVVRRHQPQRQQHHRRVIHVRVPLVVELEHPPAGLDLGRVLVNPVPAEADFPGHQPLGGAFQRRVIRGHTGFTQTDADNGSIPDRRQARLDADALLGFVLEFL